MDDPYSYKPKCALPLRPPRKAGYSSTQLAAETAAPRFGTNTLRDQHPSGPQQPQADNLPLPRRLFPRDVLRTVVRADGAGVSRCHHASGDAPPRPMAGRETPAPLWPCSAHRPLGALGSRLDNRRRRRVGSMRHPELKLNTPPLVVLYVSSRCPDFEFRPACPAVCELLRQPGEPQGRSDWWPSRCASGT